MSLSERDLDLKLRIMRFLWYNGYFVRRNVDLPRYDYGKKTSDQYTDIDVLSLNITETFRDNLVICDCKSGKVAKNPERIFWLSGVMRYVSAKSGIFLRTDINESKYFDLGRKLKITPLSYTRLCELEKSYNIEKKPFIGAFNKVVLDKEKIIFNKLKKGSKNFHDYIISRYWTDSPHKQIKVLINIQSYIDRSSDYTEEEKIFLQVYILSLLSISVLKFSEPILIFPDTKKATHIKESLLGDGIEISERKKLLASVYDFVSNEILKKSGEKYPINKENFINQIYPSYSKYLLDLTQRICLNPIDSIQIPRFLDIIAYEFILNNQRSKMEEMLLPVNKNFNLDTVTKLSKDFIVFGNRAGFISKSRYLALNHLISEVEIKSK